MHNWVAVAIAFAVFVVGYAQWRTANQRVVVDLFDRRFKIFDKIEAAVAEVLREGVASHENWRSVAWAKAEARFLFGEDVQNYLQTVLEDIAFMEIYRGDTLRDAPNREALLDRKEATLLRLGDFFKTSMVVFSPYMRIDQKNTPFWRPW